MKWIEIQGRSNLKKPKLKAPKKAKCLALCHCDCHEPLLVNPHPYSPCPGKNKEVKRGILLEQYQHALMVNDTELANNALQHIKSLDD